MNSVDAVGRDKALACPDPVVYCVNIATDVFDDNGSLRGSDCNMAWRVYPGDATEPFEKGREDCGDDIYIGDSPMDAGPYRLEVDIEMDDGTMGSGLYNFTLLPE